jgi:hypothetical protein
MPSFSFKEGKPIAQMFGPGKLNKKFLYISEKEGEIDKLYSPEYTFEMLPNDIERQVFLICGPSGVGKSTLASGIIEKYLKVYPKSKFILFSRKEYDPVLDGLEPYRVPIDKSLVERPPDARKHIINGSIIVFDDCDTIPNDKQKRIVAKIKNDILETGRDKFLYCIVITHLIRGDERKDSRRNLNESHTVTLFPRSGCDADISNYLKNGLLLDKKKIDSILALKSKFITIGKTFPLYVLYDHGAFIL